MAEQNTATKPQHTTDVKEEDMDHVSACNEHKQEDIDISLNAKKQHSEDELNQQTLAPPTEGPSCSVEDNKLHVEKNSTTEANDGSCGDNNEETQPKEEPAEKAGDNHTGEEKAPESTAPSTLVDATDNEVDGPKARLNEELNCVDTNTETPEDGERGPEKALPPGPENEVHFHQTPLPHEISEEEELAEQRNKNVETIGPTTKEPTEHSVPEVTGIRGGSGIYLIAVCIVGLAMLLPHLLQPESPPQKNLQQIDIFLRQMEKVKSQFPNQRPELWKRSRIHLERHLNTTQPTEPVSLILTAGLRAERTLHCLAQGLASAFSSALNASVLQIDGTSKASQDSDQVKLDIDSQLQGAFEGDKPVAVIHRFEELPPGSTLIFYRYCDHENAAYKKTFLIFTVLLGEEEEIPAKIRLSTVEEMVDDHLQKKFLSHSHRVAFDSMDLDKYGGLWSRISHLILPVAAEKRIEHEGC